MLFTSFHFVLFFVLLWTAWRFAGKYRHVVLLAGSLLFICSFSWMSAAIGVVIAWLNYACGRYLENSKSKPLYVCLQWLNVLLIPAASYLNGYALFFSPGGGQDLSLFFVAAGLSFYNLQHFAYLADVWRGRGKAETQFSNYLLVSCYFPKFLSGPITMYEQIRPAIVDLPSVQVRAFPALNRILLGYFKKMVLADALAPSVNSIFDYGDTLPGLTILAGACLFTLQLYFDFSGYCDIAIGCSALLGINLPENFLFPLRATSMTDFWRRWHVTLLHFFTKYLFFPVAFRVRGLGHHAAPAGIFVVFMCSAVWHGFGFTFLIWGLCHTSYMLVEYYVKAPVTYSNRVVRGFRTALVLLLFSFSNIFFRSAGPAACRRLLDQLADFPGFLPREWPAEFLAPLAVGGHQIDLFNFYALLLLCFVFLLAERRIFAAAVQDRFRPVPAFVMLLLIFLFGVFASGHRFIYMQF